MLTLWESKSGLSITEKCLKEIELLRKSKKCFCVLFDMQKTGHMTETDLILIATKINSIGATEAKSGGPFSPLSL